MTKQTNLDDPVQRGLAILAASKHDDPTLAELVLRFFVFRRYFPQGQKIAKSTMTDVIEKEFTTAVLKEITPEEILSLPLTFWIDDLKPVDDVDAFIRIIRERVKEIAFTVAVSRSWTAKPDGIRISTETDENTGDELLHQYDLALKYGKLAFSFPVQLELPFTDLEHLKNGLSSFDKKFIQWCITTADDTGRVTRLVNRAQTLDDLGLSNAGKHWKKIKETVDKLSYAQFEPFIKLVDKKESKKGVTRFLTFPREPFLSFPEIVTYDKKNNEKGRKKLPIPHLPRFIITARKTNLYLLAIERDMLKLPDDTFNLGITILEHLRMNISRKMQGMNLYQLITETNWPISPRTEKRSIKRLQGALDDLIGAGNLGGYSITVKGTKESLPRNWYDQKRFRLTVTRKTPDGKKSFDTDTGTLQRVLYHFEPTQRFLDRHKGVIEKRQKKAIEGAK